MLDIRNEYFCTLFDSNFLPMGLAMMESLRNNNKHAHIFVLCMDEEVFVSLKLLNINFITAVNLNTIEQKYPELTNIKPNRSKVEYCWTLTPFIILYSISHFQVKRVTYIDADLFFFSDPQILIHEIILANKEILITEHAYDPKYDQTEKSGRFCVQFMTFNNSPGSLNVINWWKERCYEWCYNKHEDGKFGDQKYLDSWPEIFQKEVHILKQKYKTLAPWNVNYYNNKSNADLVFYHFHGFRLLNTKRAVLYSSYNINDKSQYFYLKYCLSIKKALFVMKSNGIKFYPSAQRANLKKYLSNIKLRILKKYKEKNLDKKFELNNINISKIFKQLVPPFIIFLFRIFFQNKSLRGPFPTWDSAQKDIIGYDSSIIHEKVFTSALKVKNNEAVFERDSVLFYNRNYNSKLLVSLSIILLSKIKNLSILDFGGSLGSTYFQHKDLFHSNIEWSIIEQSYFVEKGKYNFENDNLKFFYTIDECLKERSPNLAIFSSVLQYIETIDTTLSELIAYKFEWIFIDKTPFFSDMNEERKIAIQLVSKSIYDANYPTWIFCLEKFLKVFQQEYQLIQVFHCEESWNLGLKKIEFKGLLFKKK